MCSEDLTLKKYEAIFILDIRKVEDEGLSFSKELTGLIESLGGNVINVEPMGRLQFSYEIKKRKAGIYFDYIFEAEEKSIIQIKNRYRLDERVLRNMILVCDRPEKVTGRVKDLKELPQSETAAPAPAPAAEAEKSE